jgi:hypothetical protein
LVDTYTITFTNGTTFNFTVTNANAGNTYTKSEIEQFLAQKVNISDIINTLTSDETNKPLSAKQGKVLKGLIDNTYTSSEIDTFLSTINGNITTINSNISSLNDTKLEKTNVSDVYDSTSTYAVGDYCIYENTLYKCTTAISTAEEFDSSKWTVASISYEFKRITNELSNKLNSNKVIQESGTASTSNVYSSKAVQNLMKFSLTEHKTGEKWVDGKDVYKNTIKITSLASNSQYNHGISNFNELIQMFGSAYFTAQGWQPIHRVVTDAIEPYRIRFRRRRFYKVSYASRKCLLWISKSIYYIKVYKDKLTGGAK